MTFETLFIEIALLKEDIKNFRRGLILYGDVQERLDNISVLIDIILDDQQTRG